MITNCEVCGASVKVEKNRSLSRYYINLDKLEIQKLQKALEIANEAIEFYADSNNWEQLGISDSFIIKNDVDFKAEKAKQQIAEILKENKE